MIASKLTNGSQIETVATIYVSSREVVNTRTQEIFVGQEIDGTVGNLTTREIVLSNSSSPSSSGHGQSGGILVHLATAIASGKRVARLTNQRLAMNINPVEITAELERLVREPRPDAVGGNVRG